MPAMRARQPLVLLVQARRVVARRQRRIERDGERLPVGEVVGQRHRRGALRHLVQVREQQIGVLALVDGGARRGRDRARAPATSRSSFFARRPSLRLELRARRRRRRRRRSARRSPATAARAESAARRARPRAAAAARPPGDACPARSRRRCARRRSTSCSWALAPYRRSRSDQTSSPRANTSSHARSPATARTAVSGRPISSLRKSMQNAGAASPVPGGLSTRCMRPARASADRSSHSPRNDSITVASSGCTIFCTMSCPGRRRGVRATSVATSSSSAARSVN